MKNIRWDPRGLNVARFSADAGELQGEQSLAELTRLSESLLTGADVGPVRWRAQGQLRPEPGAPAQTWLHLQAQTAVPLQCQRCLNPVQVQLVVDRHFRFVESEALAEELDETSEDDVLALPARLDLLELLEDELLLALPLVPRHEGACPEPLQVAADTAAAFKGEPSAAPGEQGPRPNPFAVLASLRKGSGPADGSGSGAGQ
jgi:uncharacterized protein